MDLGKSFTYMFEDKDWITKLAIGGGILLVGSILGFLIIPPIAAVILILGYVLAVIRNVYEGSTTPLPEWSNIGELFTKGATAFVGVLIWLIPVLVMACCIFVATLLVNPNGASENASTFGALLITCLSCITIVVSLAISLFVYAPLTNFAINNQISTFWDFAGQWRFIRMNAGNYIIAFLLALLASFVAGFGIIACVIGVFFTNFWASLVMGHLFGQVARANMAPTDSTMLPPSPPSMDEPPSMMQGPFEPAPSA